MEISETVRIEDAPGNLGYRIHYVDREGVETYATTGDYSRAKSFAAAVKADDNDAMNGRISMFPKPKSR
jgi:hypothetical protein